MMELLRGLGVGLRINEMPNEVPNPIRFSQDREHRSYDAPAAQRFWRVLNQVDRVGARRGETQMASAVQRITLSASRDIPFDRLVLSQSNAPVPSPSIQPRRKRTALPHRLSRQGKPGAFFLGQLRSRGDPLLGAAGGAAPGGGPGLPDAIRVKPIRSAGSSTPLLPDTTQTAAQAKGRERYEAFVDALGGRLARGRALVGEVTAKVARPDAWRC